MRTATCTEKAVSAMASGLFIVEQQWALNHQLRAPFRDEDEAIERAVWSPISCRHTSWTYETQRYGRAP